MALLLVTAAGFAWLGLWQLSRLRERREANLHIAAARAAPPATMPPVPADADGLAERRIVARGRYDHAHEIVIRGDVFQGVPGVRIVTPLLLGDGGPAVLVDRGFLPAPDAVTVDTRGSEEPGERTVRGVGLPVPAGPGEPIEHDGRSDMAAARPERAARAAALCGAAGVHQAEARTVRCPRFPGERTCRRWMMGRI